MTTDPMLRQAVEDAVVDDALDADFELLDHRPGRAIARLGRRALLLDDVAAFARQRIDRVEAAELVRRRRRLVRAEDVTARVRAERRGLWKHTRRREHPPERVSSACLRVQRERTAACASESSTTSLMRLLETWPRSVISRRASSRRCAVSAFREDVQSAVETARQAQLRRREGPPSRCAQRRRRQVRRRAARRSQRTSIVQQMRRRRRERTAKSNSKRAPSTFRAAPGGERAGSCRLRSDWSA